MQFHTWVFLVFFIIVYAVYLLLRPTRFWLHWLLLASYVFYAWWNPLYLILIAYSTALDYFCVARMQRSGRRGLWLTISLVNNLGLLGFFKYAGFVTENINTLLAMTNSGYTLQAPGVLLPVGISFFTFQSMSYTIDYYRGRLQPESSFVRFAAFVSFFPQLVAGPIERASALLPQMRTAPRVTRLHLADGTSLFITGLMKKVALADYLSGYVDPIYANPSAHSSSTLACATVAFAWQIYFDFSGYTDMARGIARLMGFDLMLNFNHPYLATGMRDFWSRWHISLSTWFRDYVYIPLGGNRKSRWKTYRNLFLTMVISGLWHGAAWTFIIWGTLHGVAYVLLRPLEESAWYRNRVPTLLKRVWVFGLICLTWVFFRASSLSDALIIVKRIAAGTWSDPGLPILAIVLVSTVFVYQWVVESHPRESNLASPWRLACYLAVMLYLSFAIGSVNQPFIYFQF